MPTSPEPDRNRKTAAAFSEWLRARMESAGYSTVGDRPRGQARLVKDTGIAPSVLSRALNGASVPSVTVVFQLATALGAKPSEGLRAAGYHPLADYFEKMAATPESTGERDPIAARIGHASELSIQKRAWLAGYYERRRLALAAEIDELIRFATEE